MRFCPSQLPRSEPPVVSQRSQMSNQSHPAPDIKHGLSRMIFRWTTPTMLQRKLAATMTHPQPPSGGGGGAFPKSFFESISFNWGKVISGDRSHLWIKNTIQFKQFQRHGYVTEICFCPFYFFLAAAYSHQLLALLCYIHIIHNM